VIFTSDNGALWPEICDFGPEAHDNNGPLRDYKASVYEGGHRVPFIVKWPARVRPNSVSDELVLGQDWVATLYELTGQPMDADQAMDSTSLMPLLLGESLSQPLHPFVLYQAGFAYDGAIREGDMVLMVDRENEATELYDLGADLAQANNLIGNPEYAQLVARLQAKFLLHNDHDDATFGEPRTTAVLRVD
jgi:arylsulfatase A-like enzyme